MSHLTYYNYDGVGKRNRAQYKYSQPVRIGDRIECSGQGQYNPACTVYALWLMTEQVDGIPPLAYIHREINAQIDQAFVDVELNLKDAGGMGWEQVFRVNFYHVRWIMRRWKLWFEILRYMPNHQPLDCCWGAAFGRRWYTYGDWGCCSWSLIDCYCRRLASFFLYSMSLLVTIKSWKYVAHYSKAKTQPLRLLLEVLFDSINEIRLLSGSRAAMVGEKFLEDG